MGAANRHRGRPPTRTPTELLERQRKLGRERQDRRKLREARGAIVLPLEIDHLIVDLMLEAGAVDEVGSRNRKRLASAIIRTAINALSAAVASGRKFHLEKEEQHARTHTEGNGNGLRQRSNDPAKAGVDRRG